MLLIALALAVQVQDPVHRDSAQAVPPDAYADVGTGDLVSRARAARSRNERLVTSYRASVTQRLGVGIHALSRDRMMFHQELAAHIEWYRDRPSRIEVVGARQAVPIALSGEQVPDGLRMQVRWLVLNPAEDYLRVVGAADSDGFVYPLRQNGEADYRFASGDTTTITLPSGRTVQLVELRVSPRRSDFRLMSGSLWFDAETYGLVRAVFKPARPYDLRRDADSSDRADVPSWLNVGAEVKYVTLEYGLYSSRWWLPRYMAVDAIATMGSLVGMPFRFERIYTDYVVEGGTPPPEGSTFRAAGSIRNRSTRESRLAQRARADSLRRTGGPGDAFRADSLLAKIVADSIRFDSVRTVRRACLRHERDSIRAESRRQRGARVTVQMGGSDCFPGDSNLVVVVPADTAVLLSSPELGPPILNMGDVINQNELQQLASEIGALGQRPWEFHPELPHGLIDVIGHLRYNRVEALSLGLGGQIDFGRLKLDGNARVGLADWQPNVELGLTRPADNARFRLGLYRRLTAANPDLEPLDLGNSLSSFFLQRDDGQYFRAWGAEVTGSATTQWYSWRIYAERQHSASVGTQFSLPHVFNSADSFNLNIVAPDADQAGASLTVRGSRVVSSGLTLGAEASIDGATGTFRYGRGALTLRSTVVPPGPFVVGLEASAGSSTGSVPVQGAFFLGGPPTLRGYDGGAFAGDAYWRGRVDVGTKLPAFRLTVFGDAGWAGSRSVFASGRAAWGAGVGMSFLDGLVRFDLARAFSPPKGWRFDMYLDAAL